MIVRPGVVLAAVLEATLAVERLLRPAIFAASALAVMVWYRDFSRVGPGLACRHAHRFRWVHGQRVVPSAHRSADARTDAVLAEPRARFQEKPFSPDTLAAVVKSLLDRRETLRSPPPQEVNANIRTVSNYITNELVLEAVTALAAGTGSAHHKALEARLHE